MTKWLEKNKLGGKKRITNFATGAFPARDIGGRRFRLSIAKNAGQWQFRKKICR